MSELGALTVKISADTTELKSALKDADNQVKKTGESLDSNLASSLRNIAIVSAAAVAGLGYFVKSTMDAIGANVDLAYRLNTTVASLQALQRAAQLAGVEDASGMLTIFNRQLSEAAATAEGPASDALKRLNLTAGQLLSLPIDERVALLGTRMMELIPAGQQAAVATAFFGRSAQQMLEVLRNNSAISDAKKELRDLGVLLDDIDAQKVDEAGDSMTTFGLAVQGAGNQLSLALAPVIYKISQDFAQAARETGGFKTVMEGVALVSYVAYEGIVGVAKGLAMVAMQGAIAVQQLDEFLFRGNNTESIGKLQTAINEVWASIKGPENAVASFKAVQDELAKVAQQALDQKQIGNTDVGGVGMSEKDRKALDDKIKALREATMQELELEQFKYDESQKLLLTALEAKRLTMEEYNKIMFDLDFKHAKDITDIAQKTALDRIAIADRESRETNAMRTQTANLAVGLLQTIGQKSKAAALAAILLNRGLMIATAIQNTAAAATRALVYDPTGATSAYVSALGYAQVGIIAATGLLEAGGAMSGDSGSIGAGGNTVGTNTGSVMANANALTPNTGASPNNNAVVQITLVGDNYGKEQVRNLITAINDAVADGSTLRLT